MRDLTDRALDTATALGASYADARVVRRLDESDRHQDRPGRRRRLGRERGLRRPRPRRRRVGLRRQPHPDAGRGRPRRRARPSGSPGPAPPPCASPSSLDDRPPANGPLRDARRGGPVRRSRSRRKIADLLAADEAAARVKGIAFTESMYAAQREWKTFAATDGSLHRAGHHPRRRRRSRPTPSTATSTSAARYPDSGGGWQAAGYEFIRGLDLARARRAAGRRGGRAADRAAVPVRPVHDRPRPVASSTSRSTRSCGHPTELDRVFGTEASLRRDQLPDDRQARRGLPLRLRPHRHRRRRDRARRHGHVRLGRRGRRGPGRAARPGRDLRRLPDAAARRRRGSAGTSGGAMRADGWNRIPLIRMTNINLLPKPGMSLDEIVADTDDGLYLASNRSLVDRRPAAELPVRDRGRLRDQGRQEGPAVQEPDLHRHHLRVLALVRRGRRRAELRDARHAELRQGRAGPDRPRRPRRPGRPLPRRPGRASASGERRR